MTAFADPFPENEVRHFTGRGGKVFDYIEDETVMSRLDDVVGVGNWSITVEPISVADGIVKVRLEVAGAAYEDFGYTSNADGEALKEAVSDGIRRVGRMVGIARYLYLKHDSTNGATPPRRPPATAAATVPPRPAAVANPYATDPYPEHLADIDAVPEAVIGANECPTHRKPYRDGKKGLYCPNKLPDGTWCPEPRR